MKNFTKIVGYVIEHRRPIALIIGGLLSLMGMEDILNGPMV